MNRRPVEGRMHGLLSGSGWFPRLRSHAKGRHASRHLCARRKNRRAMAKASRRNNR